MSNEIPGEGKHWKDRLEGLDSLPGEPWAGKDAAWETLHDRLHAKAAQDQIGMDTPAKPTDDKQRRIAYLPYWMAAASILLALGIWLAIGIRRERRPDAGVAARIPVLHSVQSPAARTPAKMNAQPESFDKAKVASNRAEVPYQAPASDPATTSDSVIAYTSTVVPAPAAAPAPTAGFSPTRLATDTPAIASLSTPHPPRKLQVVSVNDLPDPSGKDTQADDMEGGATRRTRGMQLNLLNNLFNSRTSIENSQPGSNMLHVKIHR